MIGQDLRIAYTDPFWYVQQKTIRYVRAHDSSIYPTPDRPIDDWETRGIYNNFYTAVIETLQLGVEEECDVVSVDYAHINPQSTFMVNLRASLTSLTL